MRMFACLIKAIGIFIVISFADSEERRVCTWRHNMATTKPSNCCSRKAQTSTPAIK